MKFKSLLKKYYTGPVALVGLRTYSFLGYGQTQTQTIDASDTFTIPYNIASVRAKIWRADGGGFIGNNEGSGSSGGAYFQIS